MSASSKRAAIKAYKARAPVAGVYAVRCGPSDQVWVGATPTLDTIQTRLWFTFRMGGAPQRDAQADWTAHGEGAFTFERLEMYDEGSAGLTQAAWLKDRAAHWRAVLNASSM